MDRKRVLGKHPSRDEYIAQFSLASLVTKKWRFVNTIFIHRKYGCFYRIIGIGLGTASYSICLKIKWIAHL